MKLNEIVFKGKYAITADETWEDCCERVHRALGIEDPESVRLMQERKFSPAGRVLCNAGKPQMMLTNCMALGWTPQLYSEAEQLIPLGCGLGILYENCNDPVAEVIKFDRLAKKLSQTSRRAANLGSIMWDNPQVNEFLELKNHTEMNFTNLSVVFEDYNRNLVSKLLKNALTTGEPGILISRNGEKYFNTCTEVVSDEPTSCNIGIVNIAACESLEEFELATRCLARMLLKVIEKGFLPIPWLLEERQRNKRIGVGITGLAEFLYKRNKPYVVDSELRSYLQVYKDVLIEEAPDSKKRACWQPAGSLGIVLGTTTSLEPVFYKSYIRRYTDKSGKYVAKAIVDPMYEKYGDAVFDSTDIDFETKIKFLTDCQEYIDMAVSSTTNIDGWGSVKNNFMNFDEKLEIIESYWPKLKNISIYPNAAIENQPFLQIPIEEAMKYKDREVLDDSELRELTCKSGLCSF